MGYDDGKKGRGDVISPVVDGGVLSAAAPSVVGVIGGVRVVDERDVRVERDGSGRARLAALEAVLRDALELEVHALRALLRKEAPNVDDAERAKVGKREVGGAELVRGRDAPRERHRLHGGVVRGGHPERVGGEDGALARRPINLHRGAQEALRLALHPVLGTHHRGEVPRQAHTVEHVSHGGAVEPGRRDGARDVVVVERREPAPHPLRWLPHLLDERAV
mmetsp:Transcript_15821/g.51833  ORF Transcript_15821/g.51833 Transcript_15821/m.51833 type:complete len:221 (+) Transcript_15821:60-722(+)